MNIAKTLELEKTTPLEGEYNSEKFHYEVRTNVLTPQLLQRIMDIDTRPMELANALSELLVSWDIDLNGEPFPPTVGNLAKVPFGFLRTILDQIADHLRDTADEKRRAANG
jgi:hypothetical protein